MRAFVIAFALMSLAPLQYAEGAHSGKDLGPPQILSSGAPEYTDEGRAARIEGFVELRLDIDAEGHLKSGGVVKGLPYGLNDAAVKCVGQWTFSPATIDRKPVGASMLVKVEFRLPKDIRPHKGARS